MRGLLFVFAICSYLSIAYADDGATNAQLLQEVRQLKETVAQQAQRIADLERRLSQQEERVQQNILDKKEEGTVADEVLHGLSMELGFTGLLQGTHNANADIQSSKEDVIDSSYSLDIVFQKEFPDYGLAFVRLAQGNGAGVEDELNVFSNVNCDADNDNNVRATEAWYEHYMRFEDTSYICTLGKLDPTLYIDTNAFMNDETTQFLGRIFKNSPTIEFPDNAAGVHLGFSSASLINLNAVMLDADADWEDSLDGLFFAGQINIKPHFFSREGNYRLLAWYNDQPHSKWSDSASDKKEGYGFGLSLDQELTQYVGLSTRYAWQNPKVFLNGASFSLEHSYSIGAQLQGALWGREEDVFGIAFGQVIPSEEYKESSPGLNARAESHLECYYSFMLNEHLTLSPDIQVIWNPYGDDASVADDTIVVTGLRTQVDF